MPRIKKTATTNPTSPAAILDETLLHDDTDPLYQQALRLLETGQVDGSTTFGQIGAILARDAQEQAIRYHISEWFSHYDSGDHTAQEAEIALKLIVLDIAIQDGFVDRLAPDFIAA